jgi:hypothetical protein
VQAADDGNCVRRAVSRVDLEERAISRGREDVDRRVCWDAKIHQAVRQDFEVDFTREVDGKYVPAGSRQLCGGIGRRGRG